MSVDVSVIVTAYNIEGYIERAIRSALDQTGVTVEVIFVDDCSTDKSFAVASGISDPRLQCMRLDVNSGPGAARNAGFSKASGAWIAVLDGDDAYDPERLMRCLKRAAEMKADIVVDNLTVWRESDGVHFTMFEPGLFAKDATLDLANFIQGNSSFFASYSLGYLKPVFSADFLRRENLSYDPEIRIGEDYMLMCEALAGGAVCAIEPSPGYLYTARAGSISHRLAPADLDRMATCDRKFLDRRTLPAGAARAQKRRAAGMRDAYAFAVLVQGLKEKNAAKIWKAFKLSPLSIRHLDQAIKKRAAIVPRMFAFRKDSSR